MLVSADLLNPFQLKLTVGASSKPDTRKWLIGAFRSMGVYYSTARNYWVLDIENVPTLLELKGDRFELALTDTVENRLQAMQSQKKEWIEIGEERLKGFPLKPFPHQIIDVGRMISEKKSVINCNPVGLGKTYEALASLSPSDAVLVITKPTLKSVWRTQTSSLLPGRDVKVLKGKKEFRWPGPSEIVIANYDIMGKLETPPHPVVVIFDEAHALKNASSLRHKLAKRLLYGDVQENVTGIYFSAGKSIFLTGTPLENNPEELYQLLFLAKKIEDTFGSWDGFVKEFNGRVIDGRMEWGGPSIAAKAKLKRVLILHDKEKVLGLPPRIYSQIDLDPSKEVKEAFKELTKQMRELGVSMEDLIRLLEGGPTGSSFEKISSCFKLLAASKVPALVDLVEGYEESKTPVVVASVHRAPIEALSKRKGWKVIHGGVSEDEREAAWRDFQAGKILRLGVTIAAAGEGLTLTQASTMIFVDRHFNPQKNLQCEGRIYRIGQESSSKYIDLVWDHPLEKQKVSILNYKKELIDQSISSLTSMKEFVVAERVPETERDWLMSQAKKILRGDHELDPNIRNPVTALVDYYSTYGYLKDSWWDNLNFFIIQKCMHLVDFTMGLPD